jgi:hypothetical protein
VVSAHIGRDLDDATAVRRFSALADQYAHESGDPVLGGAVGCLRSRNAFARGDYRRAADIAAEARVDAHPTRRARLAAYEAEALAAAGVAETTARTALVDMRDASPVVTPSWTDADQAIFTAMTLAQLRDWVPAADLARKYIAGEFGGDRQGVGFAHATLGWCLLAADRPDPAEAAHAGLLAIEATRGPDASVLRRVARLHADLRRRWPGRAEVARLDAALTTARTALPVSTRKALPASGPAETAPPPPPS